MRLWKEPKDKKPKYFIDLIEECGIIKIVTVDQDRCIAYYLADILEDGTLVRIGGISDKHFKAIGIAQDGAGRIQVYN